MIQSTTAKAYRKGVKIVFGTDAGVYPHGKNNLEFLYMAEAGMKNQAILRAATLDAATMLRLHNKIGSLEPGKLADLVVLGLDPFKENPSSLITIPIERTMVGGKWVYES